MVGRVRLERDSDVRRRDERRDPCQHRRC
jgi:hypothetical protein